MHVLEMIVLGSIPSTLATSSPIDTPPGSDPDTSSRGQFLLN